MLKTLKNLLVMAIRRVRKKTFRSIIKTDPVFQFLGENGNFESQVADESHKAKWKLSKYNSELTITLSLMHVKFSTDHLMPANALLQHRKWENLNTKKLQNRLSGLVSYIKK